VLELNTTDALLAENKILTQQIEVLTKQISKLHHQLHAINPSQSSNQLRKCKKIGENNFPSQNSCDPTTSDEVQHLNNQGRQGWGNNPNKNFG